MERLNGNFRVPPSEDLYQAMRSHFRMGIRTVELFAGVGGFRRGLEEASPLFHTVWFNQWEPSVRSQHAWDCYKQWFCDKEGLEPPALSNADINLVDPATLPRHDLLVGGFPCQDYSVATAVGRADGLAGKKGVLWWAIRDILTAKKPAYVLLENVDRLLKSPVEQRGRDFAMVLACLRDLKYRVEWRVVNAADWGHPQKRRRVFIFAAHERTGVAKFMAREADAPDFLYSRSFFGKRFPSAPVTLPKERQPHEMELEADLKTLSDSHDEPFEKAGIMIGGKVWMHPVTTGVEHTAFLGNYLEKEVDARFLIDKSREEEWKTAKGPKKIDRVAENGYEYQFAEGGLRFPDRPDAPARTVLTSEANKTPNRTTHVVWDEHHQAHRVLTPREVEVLMGFPKDYTSCIPSERWRYFVMGNAVVVPMVTMMGHQLLSWIKEHEEADRAARLLEEVDKSQPVALKVATRTKPAKRMAIKRRKRNWTK